MRLLIILSLLITITTAGEKVFLKLSKTKSYINEPILAKYTVKLEKAARYITLEKPTDKNFYTKLIKEGNITKSGSGLSKSFYYALFPQATGNIELKPLSARVSRVQEKTGFLISENYKVKKRVITVFDTPNGLNVAGNLKISLQKENNSSKAKEPVNFTLKVEGYGNIDNISAFKIPIKGESYFSSKPEREYKIKDSRIYSIFTQKFTVVAEKSFTIEPITVNYFNTQTELEETLSTRKTVVAIAKPPLSKRDYTLLLAGFSGGILAVIVFAAVRRPKKIPTDLELAIKKAKDDNELYRTLLPYANREEYKERIRKLEEKLYIKQESL